MIYKWYLIHTKIRQERLALFNLERQGFECFLPMIRVERMRRSILQVAQEPLFPRYLFIRLSTALESQSWSPIRSTSGVSRLVTFGQSPAKIDDDLIANIRIHLEASDVVLRHFKAGEQVVITDGPFVGVEAIFQMADSEDRVMVLLNIMSKVVNLSIVVSNLRKVS